MRRLSERGAFPIILTLAFRAFLYAAGSLAAELPATPAFRDIYPWQNYVLLTWNFDENVAGNRLEAKTEGGTWAEIADLPAGFTQFKHEGLTPATTYLYRIRAYNSAGFSDYSPELEVTTPPRRAATLLLQARPRSYQEIELQWNDMSTDLFSTYTLQRQSGTEWIHVAFLSARTTSFPSSGFEPSTEYRFRIMIRNGDGPSDWSYASAATLPLPEIPPAAPTAFADAESETAIRVKWLKVELATGYFLERKNSAGEWQEVARVPEDSLFYIDAGLQPSMRYAYRVRAANAHGFSPYSNETAATTRATPLTPGVPILNAGASSQNVIQLYWGATEGIRGYRLERKNFAGDWEVIFETASEPFRYNDEWLEPLTTYTYRLGGLNAEAAWIYSAEVTAKTYPPFLMEAPVVKAAAVSPSSVELSWQPLPYAEMYYVGKLVGGTWVETQLGGTVTNFTDTGLSASTTYTYRVYGFNTVSSSPITEVSVTTHAAISGAIVFRSISITGDRIAFQLSGSTGQPFKIQNSSDFQTWTDATGTLTLSADMQVDIDRPIGNERLFYRTIRVE